MHEDGEVRPHSHGGDEGGRLLLVLRYLSEHNGQHEKELADIGEKLREAGQTETAAAIDEALGHYAAGNEILLKAIDGCSKNL